MILKQKYDDFSDFSDSEDDMISKYTKTEYFKSKQKNLEKEVLIIKKESSLKHQWLQSLKPTFGIIKGNL